MQTSQISILKTYIKKTHFWFNYLGQIRVFTHMLSFAGICLSFSLSSITRLYFHSNYFLEHSCMANRRFSLNNDSFMIAYHISLVKVQANCWNNNLLILDVKQLNKIMKLYYFHTLKVLSDGQDKTNRYYGMSRVKKQLSGKKVYSSQSNS